MLENKLQLLFQKFLSSILSLLDRLKDRHVGFHVFIAAGVTNASDIGGYFTIFLLFFLLFSFISSQQLWVSCSGPVRVSQPVGTFLRGSWWPPSLITGLRS